MSWQTLIDIQRENREERERVARTAPVSCPIDGTPLEERDGVRNCPMGNYRWTGGRGVVLSDAGWG